MTSGGDHDNVGGETSHRRELECLRRELNAVKERLQSMTEEKNAAYQQLQAAHQELVTNHVELRRLNQDLQNAHQELLSSHESLSTLNEALRRKNRELEAAEEVGRRTLALLTESQQTAKIGSWWLDLARGDLHWDAGACRVFGYSPDAPPTSVGAVVERLHPEDRQRAEDELRQRMDGADGTIRVGFRIILPSGEIRFVENVSRLLRPEERSTPMLIGTVQDVTERQRVEEAIHERDARLRAIFDLSPYGIAVSDLDGTLTDCNQALCNMHGFADREAMLGMSMPALIDESERPRVRDVFSRLLQQGRTANFEVIGLRRDGTRFPEEASVDVVRNAEGKPVAFLGTTRDCTERKEAEKALRESKDRLRIAIRASGGTYFEQGETFLSGVESDDMFEVCGFMPSELPPDPELPAWCRSRVHADDVSASDQAFSAFLAGETPTYQHELRFKHKSGHWVWLSVLASALARDESGRVTHLAGLCFDITERRNAAVALQQSEAKFKSYIESSPDGLLVVDNDGVLVDVNDATCCLTGYSRDELFGMPCAELFHPEEAANVAQAFGRTAAQGRTSIATRARKKDGTIRNWSLDSVRLNDRQLLGVAKDTTETSLLAEQLRHSEKMRAIGQLAGGVAHDFNNQLTGVLGYAELVREEAGGNPSLLQYVDNIVKSIERASELTAKLLAFSRQGRFLTVTIDIHSVVFEIVGILRRTLDKRITILEELRASPSTTTGDPSQLQNAILNLALNARDAMPAGGTLVFRTEVVKVDAGASEKHPADLCPGNYLVLSVEDSGLGMDVKTRQRLFEPFFTTKEPGHGTGMGLPAVYGIVKGHGGAIAVRSELGLGSTFLLYFPSVAPADVGRAEPKPGPRPDEGNAHILLVEDEAVVRNVATKMLQRIGYTVSACANGADAVALYRKQWQTIALVILDVIMPEMDGEQTFVALREVNPSIVALVSSGYSIDSKAQRIVDLGAKGFLQKPYQLSELSLRVAELIEASHVPRHAG